MLLAPAALLLFLIPYDLYKLVKLHTSGRHGAKTEHEVFLPWSILLPTVAFVVFYSILPHKELRFILAAVAGFNVCTAFALSRLWQLRAQYGSSSKNRWMKRAAEVLLLLNGCILNCLYIY
jgi:hypothetical protein